MEKPADFRMQAATDRPTAALSGDWTTNLLAGVGERLAQELRGRQGVSLDLTKVRRMDTAGAYAIVRAVGTDFKLDQVVARPETRRLLELVDNAARVQPVVRPEPRGFHNLTIRIGRGMVNLGVEFLDTMGFLGHLLVVALRALVNLVTAPHKVRWAPIFTQMERAGLDAIPIVAITTFFIGAVVALLGVNMLRQFGAEVFVVELIGVAVIREFNIVITAVLLSGRSASAFAAELGSMKMQQEVDAMQVMGVDPFEALVLPRFIALLVTIPLLTFVATLAGLLGGLMVTWSTLGLGPTFFLQRIVDNVGATHFWIALSKAPVMAGVVAGIGCRQGLLVGGDVQSLGQRVTAAVVHAIFAIIMLDAVFALIYMELDL
ncbi:MAG: ABC transporter permease [Phenylobacterium sp. RIFCSPHIGHO2_01_FULL_69_31]|jgi:phospholipid/cholesterol/gamma-HCH transport system permease protein|uniref:ABC transporter permease n=1 Tax=Phenylobacterium sp. RIFCSPHIGHO2_01_FULL_69_31 TaxID=1801944 RepID=UPI0008CA7A22|nr:ABC transporter permease [Phenylobacterium sp. RIFCSPHIGHO2_01_FULL_69_31]OHB26443.1 MAG: ABC transporter permease [Phenylobacterium sp. RIFCSPHIGHO2_01_FULL_69_31]